ncbi:hypothetical protein MPTK1_1g06840 [Marchantia polymorpha subsp. ruderalis]|uniref:HNH nuclease domain-containing protein n=2 Tax=Marchantia polymorpha TaxID=3197 RepID=A0AAF6AMC4_MARPO|nr:hypothetical protein MARPO_0043s0076 [Marchantia polymorpha]BBM97594.1 hypothetical protein Mp_1g06840 [Marchantia polymorpha subsp. ruderalis]|eukprot:PTQ39835.1 hypothetical protein MARPO_0043s0076 [Marchantia polymorpha]
MVNGGAYLLVSDRPFLRGSGRCLDLSPAVRNSPILRFRGSEIRRRYCQPTICKLKKGDDLLGNSKLARKSKRKGVDLSEARTLQQLQSSDSIYASSVRGFSTKSVASPASEMEMVAEEDMEADDDDELSVYRGLVLDMAYRPINVVNWKRALCLDILEKADVLEYYDQVIYSPNRAFFIPAVLKICNFVHSPGQKMVKLTLNRSNVFMRDKFCCQYCTSRENLTIDHVQAASRGGGWTWDNLVTACSKCNLKKADKTLEEARMKLIKPPKEPKALHSKSLPPNYKTFRSLTLNKYTPAEWRDYLPRGYPSF